MNQQLFVEKLKEQFGLNVDVSNFQFNNNDISPYNSVDWINELYEETNAFGEELSVLYKTDLTIFNIKYSLKILSFVYNDHGEILKLEIKIHDENLRKEVANCRNFLQRKRNINLVFEVLGKIAELAESRCLVRQLILEKYPGIQLDVIEELDHGLNVKYCDMNSNVKYLEANWTIEWIINEYEINDLVEFYIKDDIHRDEKLNNAIKKLIKPQLSFREKLRNWRTIIEAIHRHYLDESTIDLTIEDELSAGQDADVILIN